MAWMLFSLEIIKPQKKRKKVSLIDFQFQTSVAYNNYVYLD